MKKSVDYKKIIEKKIGLSSRPTHDDCIMVMKEAVKQSQKIINEQDRMIGELTRKNNYLTDTEQKRKQWLRDAKKQAGYSDYESFDKVWAETLKKANGVDTN